MKTYSTPIVFQHWVDFDVGIDDIYGWGLLPLHTRDSAIAYWGLSLCLGWFEVGLTLYQIQQKKGQQ